VSQPLIIDPVLSWATYLGGSGDDSGSAIAVDQAGNAYVTGATHTPGSGFPGTAGSPLQSTFGGGNGDAFVTKINAAGTALVYSTYLGGSGADAGGAIAVDQAGNAYVTGGTSTPGSGFAGTAGSLIQSTYGGGQSDVFVTKLNAAGTALVYSTYLGGSGGEAAVGIAVDQAGQAYVTGGTSTPGSGFPGTAGSLPRARLMAAKMTPSSRSSTQPARPSSTPPIWAAAAMTTAKRSPWTRRARPT